MGVIVGIVMAGQLTIWKNIKCHGMTNVMLTKPAEILQQNVPGGECQSRSLLQTCQSGREAGQSGLAWQVQSWAPIPWVSQFLLSHVLTWSVLPRCNFLKSRLTEVPRRIKVLEFTVFWVPRSRHMLEFTALLVSRCTKHLNVQHPELPL